MVGFLSIVGILVLISLFSKGFKTPDEAEADEKMDRIVRDIENGSNNTNESMEKEERTALNERNDSDTKELMMLVLRELGCNPEELESDGTPRILVMYQGEKLGIDCIGSYVQIWDPGWASVSVDDPMAQNLKQAVNRSNFDNGATVIMTEPNDEGMMYLHTKMLTIFVPELPDIVEFTSSTLNHVVFKKNRFHQTFHELMSEKQAELRNRRPIGFASQGGEEVA